MRFFIAEPGRWLLFFTFSVCMLNVGDSVAAAGPGGPKPGSPAAQESAMQDYGWQLEYFGAGVDGTVYAATVYDGQLVFGGDFMYADGTEYNGIATWNGSELSPLETPGGVGVNGQVNALVVYDGQLVVAGDFTRAGGVAVDHIARWDGSSWSALAAGTSATVNGLAVFDGELVAGGDFDMAGDQTVNHVARWDGTAWSALTGSGGSGTTSWVNALAVYDGNLVVGGAFGSAGGVLVGNIARWDGQDWYPLTGPGGTGVTGDVRALEPTDTELYVGGDFGTAGSTSVSHVARWDGSRWAELAGCCGVGVSGSSVRAIAVYDGDVVVGGSFDAAGGHESPAIARWSGSQWHTMSGPGRPGGYEHVHALETFGGELIVGTRLNLTGNPSKTQGVVRWDGNDWRQLSGTGDTGLFDNVSSSVIYEGQLVVAGAFETAGTQVVNHVARWNGSTWTSLGNGVDFEVFDLVIDGDRLVAVGNEIVSTSREPRVAYWDGTSWTAVSGLSNATNGYANSATVYNGLLVVGGNFSHAGAAEVNNIAGWNGDQWVALQTDEGVGVNGWVSSVFVHDGELVVGGDFSNAGGQTVRNIARWDGTDWMAFPGLGVDGFAASVSALTEMGGDLFVGGRFGSAGSVDADSVARWDGSEWHALGSGIGDIAVYSMGAWGDDLVATGRFYSAGGSPASSVARWDGVDWVALGPESANGIEGQGATVLPMGDSVLIGGQFPRAGGSVPSWNLAKFTPEPSEVEIVNRTPEVSDIGEPVQVTAQVYGLANVPANGRGTIYASSGDSCTTQQLEVDSGFSSFSCALEITSGGSHDLNASFFASPTHEGSVSQPVGHFVRTASQTSITGVVPASEQLAGQPIELLVTVDGAAGPVGTVDIGDGQGPLCTVVLPDNRCTFSLTELGSTTLNATYSGDSHHGPSADSVEYEVTESSLVFSPNPVDFGAVGIGQSSGPKTVTVSNPSDTTVSIIGISLPDDASYQPLGGTCGAVPIVLVAGANCTLEYSFSPTQTNHDDAQIQVSSDAPEGTHFLVLQGVGKDRIYRDRFRQP